MKIDVLLPNASLYEVLHHFTGKLFEALQRAGHSCRLLEGDQRYLVPLESPPEFTIAFNGALRIDDGRLYNDLIHIPHVACLVDPHFRFFDLLASRYMLIACDDAFCRQDLLSMNFHNAFFMPHAVEPELAPDPQVERIYDVAMLATFVDCEKRRAKWKELFPQNVCQGMEEAVAEALSDGETSFILALERSLKTFLFDEQGKYKVDLRTVQTIFSEVEMYIKGRDKLDLLQAVSGHQVHVFGKSVDDKGWKEYFNDRPNIIVHPGVSFREALEIMKRTRILLNSCIKNKHGAHERIFSAAACGAVVVANDNSYLRRGFVDGEEILLYQRAAFAELDERIHRLLSNEKRRQAVAVQGRQKVMDQHTWDHRVAKLIPEIAPVIKKTLENN